MHTQRHEQKLMFMSLFYFRGAYGHDIGKRPWITGDETIVGLMNDIVGKYCWGGRNFLHLLRFF